MTDPKNKNHKCFIRNSLVVFEGSNVSEYEIKPIAKKELPPARIGIYDKMKADLEKEQKGIYEISIRGKKAYNVVASLRKKLDSKKVRVFTRSGRCFVEVL